MIPLGLIILSALISAAAVALAGRVARWPDPRVAVAAMATLLAVVAWRLAANALSLNGDFMPAISVGDAVCLLAGGIPPAVLAALDRTLPRKPLPAIAGALAAFLANVIVL
jgi:hypothetical protein